MTLYLTSGKISHDPKPYLSGNSHAAEGTRVARRSGAWDQYTPRPEFEHDNPILVQFRKREALDGRHNHYGAVQWANFTERVSYWDGSICAASPEQIDHAHRVLTKLAALS